MEKFKEITKLAREIKTNATYCVCEYDDGKQAVIILELADQILEIASKESPSEILLKLSRLEDELAGASVMTEETQINHLVNRIEHARQEVIAIMKELKND